MNRLLVPAAMGLTLAIGACGSSTTVTPATSAAPNTQGAASGGGATIAATTDAALGQILVDGGGKVLYLWEADKSTKSTCSGTCAQAWPALTTSGAAQATGAAEQALIATTTRDDGTAQVTYNGHPLYTFKGDAKAGDMNGEGSQAFGAGWYVVSPAGSKVEKPGS